MSRILLMIPFLLLSGLAIGDTTDVPDAVPRGGGMRRGGCDHRGGGCGHGARRGACERAAATADTPQAGKGGHARAGRGRRGRGHGQGPGHGRGAGGGLCDMAATEAAGLERLAPAGDEFRARLHEALLRERIAYATYLAMAERWPRPRRWAHLASAEARHRDAVAALLRAWGESPALEGDLALPAFDTAAEASAVATRIEQGVIALYDDLIRDCPDEGARGVLQKIQAANRRHREAVTD